MRSNSFIGGLFMGLIFTVLGYFVAFSWGKPILDEAKVSLDWPTTQGVVQVSKVERSRSGGSRMYNPFVEYAYSVDNKKYTSSIVYFGDNYSSGNSKGSKKIVRRYPEGAQVTVSYNPDMPDEAVLEPGAKMPSCVIFLIGLGLFGGGILLLLSCVRRVFSLFLIFA